MPASSRIYSMFCGHSKTPGLLATGYLSINLPFIHYLIIFFPSFLPSLIFFKWRDRFYLRLLPSRLLMLDDSLSPSQEAGTKAPTRYDIYSKNTGSPSSVFFFFQASACIEPYSPHKKTCCLGICSALMLVT